MGKVLIADDDALYRGLASEAMRELGLETVETSSGARALSLLANAPEGEFELAILDVFMARMNGIDALAALRRRAEFTGAALLPVVVMTGDESLRTELAVREAKADIFLLKPFEKEVLKEDVRRLLHLGRGGTAGEDGHNT